MSMNLQIGFKDKKGRLLEDPRIELPQIGTIDTYNIIYKDQRNKVRWDAQKSLKKLIQWLKENDYIDYIDELNEFIPEFLDDYELYLYAV